MVLEIFYFTFLYVCFGVCGCIWMPEEGIRSPGEAGAVLYGYWEPNSGSLEDAFLTTEPSLKPP